MAKKLVGEGEARKQTILSQLDEVKPQKKIAEVDGGVLTDSARDDYGKMNK